MATYTVTYRDSNGTLTNEPVEASNRNEAFAQFKGRGITPVSIKEGGAPKSPATPRRRPGAAAAGGRKPGLRKGLVALLLIAVAGGLTLWLLRSPAPPAQPDAPKRVEPKKPSPPVRVTSVSTNPAPVVAAVEPPPPAVTNWTPNGDAEDPLAHFPHKVENAYTNGIGTRVTIYRTPDGKRHMFVQPARSPLPTGVDEVIAMAVAGQPNAQIPPIPIRKGVDMDQQFREALKKEIVVNDTDSDRVKELKQSVIAAREEIKRRMDNGESFAEIIAGHRELSNENNKIRDDALRELRGIVDSGDEVGARDYLNKMNIALQQMGIAPMKMPLSTKQHRDEFQAYRAQKEAEKAAKAAAEMK